MKTKRKKQDPLVEYIKANRKGSREAELENHGRPVSHNRIHVSKNEGRCPEASALFVFSGLKGDLSSLYCY